MIADIETLLPFSLRLLLNREFSIAHAFAKEAQATELDTTTTARKCSVVTFEMTSDLSECQTI